MMRSSGGVLAVTLAVCAAASLATAQPAAGRVFKARLATVPMDLSMAGAISGTGTATATLRGRSLSIAGSFKGLRTAATSARLHRGANTGLRGAPVFDLMVSTGTDGEISGTFDLSPAQVDDLGKGRLYIQLHSEKAPDGNLWGWLLPGK